MRLLCISISRPTMRRLAAASINMGTQDMQRRALLGGTMGAAAVAVSRAQSVTPARAQSSPIDHAPPEPVVWPALVKLPSGIRSFNGHTDTVLDVIGRIGTPPSLVIFTEGNHLMVL